MAKAIVILFLALMLGTFHTSLSFLGKAHVYAEEKHSHHRDMDGEKHNLAAEETGSGENAGICPVLGGKADAGYFYTYEGKTYYFCCSMCMEEFKKDPQKYISRIKEINVEAYQFGFSPDPIEVRKGDVVKFLATSRDVTHGIYIKEYGINVPVEKEAVKKIEFIADKAGEFDVICSVYCGRGHSNMKAKLIVKE